MNRCMQLGEILQKHVSWQPHVPHWFSRSHGFFCVFLCAWCCGYPRTVLSLEQGLTILLCLLF